MNFEQKYHVIGIMSGTSLDGIDIVKCVFTKRNQWEFYIEEAYTSEYNIKWKSKLRNLHHKNKSEIQKAHISYGELIAKEILKFIKKYSLYVDIICSHGHTILHEPHKKITLQIGCGQTIARITSFFSNSRNSF